MRSASAEMILVDTSIWIAYFAESTFQDSALLTGLIEQQRVAVIRPIIAEVLSGAMSEQSFQTIRDGLLSLPSLDMAWQDDQVWSVLIALSRKAREKDIALPGLIDRMIFLAAHQHGAILWTADRRLRAFAVAFEQRTIEK